MEIIPLRAELDAQKIKTIEGYHGGGKMQLSFRRLDSGQ